MISSILASVIMLFKSREWVAFKVVSVEDIHILKFIPSLRIHFEVTGLHNPNLLVCSGCMNTVYSTGMGVQFKMTRMP